MKYKSIAVIAVLAMFLACSVCIPLAAHDGNGEGLKETDAEPLVIDANTPSFEKDEYNATYDKDTTTLTFNGGVSVNCTCTKEKPFIINAALDHLTVIVKGETVLKSKVPINDDGGGINVKNDNDDSILIRGDGKLTLVPNYSYSSAPEPLKTSTGINARVVYIYKTNLVIDGSQVGEHLFRGIRAVNGYITVLDSYLKITGTGKINDSKVNEGLHTNNAVTIRGSTIEMDNMMYGITEIKKFDSIDPTGTCTIASSKVTINTIGVTGSNFRSIPINSGTLIITDSTVDATAGDATGGTAEESGHSVAVNTNYLRATNSIMKFTGAKGSNSSGLEFASEATVTDCTLTCTSEHGEGTTAQSGIKATNGTGLLTAYNSVIASTDKKADADNSYGIIANCIFVQSSVKAEGNKAFNEDYAVKFEMDAISSLEGSNDGTNYSAIAADKVYDYKYIRSAMGCTVSFDLNGGKGAAIEPFKNAAKGTKIILPKCDATKGSQVFAGWNDGKKIYKAGDEYVVDGTIELHAVYNDVGTPESKGSDNTCLVVAIVIIGLAAIVTVIDFAVFKKN